MEQGESVDKPVQRQQWKDYRECFDRWYKKTKKQYWCGKHNYLLNIQSHDSKSFWKYIDELGIANDRRLKIPWNIELPDGTLSTNKSAVMNKRKCHF